ncbi:hypothetical protein LTR53_019018, partial [Teratosphaeriaceae sp. CCFEE 6253]
CFRAIYDLLQSRLKSKNVHSEIVFSLSPNNNIAGAFRTFGVAETTRDLLVVKVGGDQALIHDHLIKHVEGQMLRCTDENLTELRDEGRIRKAYKVEVSSPEAEAFIVGSMALK